MKFSYNEKLDIDGFFREEADVHAWCKAMGISQYRYTYSDFHQAMALSVQNSVYLTGKLDELSQLPVRFDKAGRGLWLSKNQLTSLVGLPKSCKTIHLENNPLSFETLMPLRQIENLELIVLPIELKKELEAKGIQFGVGNLEGDNYIYFLEKATPEFKTLLSKIAQQQNEKALQQNQASLLALNQAFQQKNLFKVKGQRHDV